MGRYGLFPISVGSSHKKNLTPHVAITLFGAIQFLINCLHHSCPMPRFTAGKWRPSMHSTTQGCSGAMGFLRSVRADFAGHSVLSQEDRRAEDPPYRRRRHLSRSPARADCWDSLVPIPKHNVPTFEFPPNPIFVVLHLPPRSSAVSCWFQFVAAAPPLDVEMAAGASAPPPPHQVCDRYPVNSMMGEALELRRTVTAPRCSSATGDYAVCDTETGNQW